MIITNNAQFVDARQCDTVMMNVNDERLNTAANEIYGSGLERHDVGVCVEVVVTP